MRRTIATTICLLLMAVPCLAQEAGRFQGCTNDCIAEQITVPTCEDSGCSGEDPWTQYARMSPAMLGSGGGATACLTGTIGSIFEDGFEGTGSGGSEHSASWTNIGGTNNFAYSCPAYAGKPSSPKCNYGLNLAPANSAAIEMLDLGSTYSTIYIKLDFYVTSHSLSAGTSATLIRVCSDTDQTSCLNPLQLYSSNGSDTLLRIADATPTTYEINKDTWYTLETQFIESNGTDNCFIKLDGETVLTFNGVGITGTPRYAFFGTGSTNRTYNIILAYIGVDEDGVW